MAKRGKQEKSYRHRELNGRPLRPETLMMGYGYDPALSEGALKCPIFQTSTFVFRSAEEGRAFFEVAYGLRERGPTEVLGLIYSRLNNPDLEILEDRYGTRSTTTESPGRSSSRTMAAWTWMSSRMAIKTSK